MTVSPATAELTAPGATVQLSAEVRDQNGQVMAGATVTWSSSATAVATVSASGLVTAVATGNATITATAGEVSATSEITVANPDRAALVALYNATNGPNWVDNTNWLTDAPLGEWYGVSTDRQGRVVQINLAGRWDSETRQWVKHGLSGEIPPELGNLSNLERLGLDVNAITGEIPPELGKLAELELLSLNRNALSGEIPPELGNLANLEWLTLNWNNLSGEIPPELGNLAKLWLLDLYLNALSGEIPPELGELANLEQLLLSWNALSGEIPPELGKLANLWLLDLDANTLSGEIPPELRSLANLEHLDLTANALSGEIPPELGELANLRRLTLGINDLSGPIPPELGSLSKLQRLGLGENELGAFPQTFLNLLALRRASYECSNAGICVPGTSAFVDWTKKLDDADQLAFCNASDQAVLSSFYELASGDGWAESGGWLGGPALEEWHGVETDTLGRVTALVLSDNGLAGSLPGGIAGLGQLASLRIDGNKLGGRLPLALTALDLEEFHYDGTDLCEPADAEFHDWLDAIPSHRGTAVQCPPLTERDALVALFEHAGGPGWTNSNGWLTEAPLRSWSGVEVDGHGHVVGLSLSRNALSGEIPPELGGLADLERLYLNGNALSGEILPELGNLANLEQLYLNGNALSGKIPPELGRLSNLKLLYLSRNDLSGEIPPELGGLSNLGHLDLAWNGLSGAIPPELGSLSNLRSLSLHGNGLAGAIPPELGGLSNLRSLSLYGNGLAGAIPPDLGGLSNLWSLSLDENELTGPIPPDLGNLANLRRMHLANNTLSGAIPPTFGELARLTELVLSHNPGLAGAMPADLRNLALESLIASGTDLCVPREPAFEEWLATIPKQRIATCGDPPAAYLVQAVQSRAHPVPLVAGEDALLRVFVTAAMETTEGIPDVRARFYVNGTERHVANIPGSSTPIPTEIYEGDLSKSANAEIPGLIVLPGLEMVVEIDPEGVLDPVLGVSGRVPEEGRLAIEVQEVPSLHLTVIPFLWTSDPDSAVIGFVEGMENDPDSHFLLADTHVLLPVADISVTARAPVASTSNNAFDLLGQTMAIRVLEGGGGQYMGMMSGSVTGSGGVASGRSSFSEPNSGTIAHELGHNMSLRHSPCRAPEPDPSFPYPDGTIGAWGYDFRSGRLVPTGWRDHMSYCDPAWTSDYHFTNALRHRLSDEGASAEAHAAAAVESLLLWGGVDTTGAPFLNPVFVADAPPALPDSAGDYTVTGRDASGKEAFSLSFPMLQMVDGDGSSSFVFALPAQPDWRDALASVTLSGPAGTATLDADSHIPMAILRDPRTGQVRGILRDPPRAGEVAADGAGVRTPGLEVLFSRGIPGAGAWTR